MGDDIGGLGLEVLHRLVELLVGSVPHLFIVLHIDVVLKVLEFDDLLFHSLSDRVDCVSLAHHGLKVFAEYGIELLNHDACIM